MSGAPDVIVVGGGVYGSAVAWELARRGVSLRLLDEHRPGCATAASAGGLWPVGEAVGLGCGVIHHASHAERGDASDGGPSPLAEAFRNLLVTSSRRYPRLAEALLEESGVDIELDVGAGLLFPIYDEREGAFVERLADSLPPDQRPELLGPRQAACVEPSLTDDLLGAAWLRGEDQVNPMLLGEALRRAAVRRGAELRTRTRVTGLRRVGDRVLGVELGDEFMPCGTVVNAAGAWAGELAASAGMTLPVVPVRGQVVLTETTPGLLGSCLSTSACYVTQKRHGEVLIGSTTEFEGFDVSVTEEAIRSLCRGAVRAVPRLRDVRVRRVWAGLRPGTPDELPVLGACEPVEGYLVAAGGFRTGIVSAPLAGELVAQVYAGETPSASLAPYRADRFAPERAAEVA